MEKIKKYFSLLFEGLRTFSQASKGATSLLLFLVPVQALVPTGIIFAIQKVVSEMSEGQGFSLQWAVIWAILLLISNILPPATTAISGFLTDVLIADINQKLIVKGSQIKTLEPFEDSNFYDDLSIVREELSWRPVNLIVFSLSNVRYIISLLSLLLLLFNYTWWLPFAILLVLIPQSLIHYRIQQEAFETLVTMRPEARKMNYLLEIALGRTDAKEARLFNIFGFLKSSYSELFNRVHHEENGIRIKQFLVAVFFIILSSCVAIFSFIYLIFQVKAGTLPLGVIVGFTSSLVAAISASNALVEESDLLYQTLLWLEKYLNLMKMTFNPQKGTEKLKAISEIEFKNVSFSYPNAETPSLKDISFSIEQGEKIAVVGRNGSGKSTLFKLLADLFEPNSGHILIDRKDLKSLDFESYWSRIAPVFQDFSKFKFPVKNAIAFGEKGSTKEALDFADLSELDEKTQLGQEFEGIDLSGGQWQKLAIARAFYKKEAQLYLFDEANSALDVQSERLLYQKLMTLANDKTVVWVTHRMTSVKLADKVLYLDNGRIKAFDHHEKLLSNPDYAALYAEQFE